MQIKYMFHLGKVTRSGVVEDESAVVRMGNSLCLSYWF